MPVGKTHSASLTPSAAVVLVPQQSLDISTMERFAAKVMPTVRGLGAK
jgi:hypothetical protein